METIDDIIKELRESAELFIKDGVDQGLENPCAVFHEYADRIEKAYKLMVEGLNGGIVERDQYIAKLTDENTRLKAALQPVLDCDVAKESYLAQSEVVWISQRIWKEGEK